MAIFKEADVTSSDIVYRILPYPTWPTGCDVIQDGRPDMTSEVQRSTIVDIGPVHFTLQTGIYVK